MDKIIFKRDEPSMKNYYENTMVKRFRVWYDCEYVDGFRDYDCCAMIDAMDQDDAVDYVLDLLGEDDGIEDVVITDVKMVG